MCLKGISIIYARPHFAAIRSNNEVIFQRWQTDKPPDGLFLWTSNAW